MGRRAFAVAAGAVLLLVGALTAAAGDVTGRDAAGDVRAPGLTRAERNALDVVSVRVLGQEGKGVIVIVTFKGKFGQAVGHGHLKRAGAAVILVPKTSAQAPVGLVTVGAGQGKTYRATASQQVGAARLDNQLAFAIVGPGFENVGSVQVKTFVKAPPLHVRASAGAQETPKLDDKSWQAVERMPAADSARLAAAGPALLTCASTAPTPAILRTEGLNALVALILPDCSQPQVAGNFVWTLSGSANEVLISGMFTGPPGTSFNGLRVVLQPQGGAARSVIDWIAPPPFTGVVVSQTVTPNDTITFSGATPDALLLVDEPTQLNVAFSGPPATSATTLQLFGGVNGQFLGPLTVPVGK